MTMKVGRLGEQYAISGMQKTTFNQQRDVSPQQVTGGRNLITLHSIGSIQRSFDMVLAYDTDTSKNYIIREQAEEFITNPRMDIVYIQFGINKFDDGYYFITNLDFEIDGGQVLDYAHIIANLNGLFLGPDNQVTPALQCNNIERANDYPSLNAMPFHAFPLGTTAYVTSGTSFLRTGQMGSPAGIFTCTRGATGQDLMLYNVSTRNRGDVIVYDDMNTGTEADWIEVLGPNHEFTGSFVMQNDLIRLKESTATGSFELFYGSGTSTWTSAGVFTYIDQAGRDYEGQSWRFGFEKIATDECILSINFLPQSSPWSTPRVSISMQRGRWDVSSVLSWLAGTAPGDTIIQWTPTTGMRYAEADSVYDADGVTPGGYAATTSSTNFIVTYATRTTYYSGIAFTYAPSPTSHYWVGTDVVDYVYGTVNDKYHSIFAVNAPVSGEDTPNYLGRMLLSKSSVVPQVVER